MEQRSRRKKRKKKNTAVVFLVEAVVLLVTVFLVYKVGIGVFQFAKGEMSAEETKETGTGEAVTLEIPKGASTKEIAKILKEKGLIKSVFSFRLKSKMGGYDGTFQQGEYTISMNTDDESIMEILKKGENNNNAIKITIPEGYTQAKIAELVEEAGLISAEEFMNEANSGVFAYAFLENIPDRPNRLEGYLFPDTYFIKENAPAHTIIDKMLSRFQEVYEEEVEGKIEGSAYTLDQIVTIASIIDAEIQMPEERPVAAGVIYNRLKEDMPLQMDSTVLYAMGITKEVVTYKDLEIDSPYNTYQNSGLPLGPICNPGQAALEAAASPSEHKYLYYVLKERGSGEHVYSETYDEFLEAKAKYKDSFKE